MAENGGGGSSNGVVAVLVIFLIVIILAFLAGRGGLFGGGKTQVNINVTDASAKASRRPATRLRNPLEIHRRKRTWVTMVAVVAALESLRGTSASVNPDQVVRW